MFSKHLQNLEKQNFARDLRTWKLVENFGKLIIIQEASTNPLFF